MACIRCEREIAEDAAFVNFVVLRKRSPQRPQYRKNGIYAGHKSTVKWAGCAVAFPLLRYRPGLCPGWRG